MATVITGSDISTGTLSTSSRPSFVARTSSSRISTSTSENSELVEYDTVIFDTTNSFNTSTCSFVAPVDGVYFFTAVFRVNDVDAGGYTRGHFSINDDETVLFWALRNEPDGYSYRSLSGTTICQLNAGDTVSVKETSYNDASVTIGDNTYSGGETRFCGYLIG